MNISGRWSLDPDRLLEARSRWLDLQPDQVERRLVDEFLMDLVDDPFASGRDDGVSGIWTGWADPFILVTYVPDRGQRRVYVIDIGYA